MKRGKIFIVFLLCLMVLPAYADAADLGELRLSLVDGDVQMKTEDTGEWVPAALNMPLRDGDQLWVPEGARAEVQARNGTAVRLDENTSFDILTADDNSVQFYLDLGQVYLNFRNQGEGFVQLDTPVSSLRVYEPSRFAVLVTERGDTDISVFRGIVYAESRSGKTTVTGGKMLSLGDNYADLSPLGRADEWEDWNRERDRIFDRRGYSSQYIPDELDEYAGDLDSNGRWVYTSSYGYVWTPTVYISADWAPYRQGRWVWIGGDYVWVSNEPWGWVPYHYGRWAFISSFGWCWVPPDRGDVYWGPGYVGWVSTPTYVAWVPLAPGEVYYGYGHYGRHSVNIINVNVNRVGMRNIYKNAHVRNGVIGVPREAFLKGKREEMKFRENPFLKDRINIGRPGIAPERATRIPVMKDIPKAKEPPVRVRDIRVKELKEKRRFVRERDKSVFMPEASSGTMPLKKIQIPKSGGALRPHEPEVIPRTRTMETEQPEGGVTEKGKKIRKKTEEERTGQPGGSAGPQPVIIKKSGQEQQPVKDQGRQFRQDEGQAIKKKKETKTTISERPSPQPDAGVAPDNGGKEQRKNVKKKRTVKDDKEGNDTDGQESEGGYQRKR